MSQTDHATTDATLPSTSSGTAPSRGSSASVIGVDIGGSGIKAAPVDVVSGELAADRIRLVTPQPATPDDVATTVAEVVRRSQAEAGATADPTARVGITLPAVVRGGEVMTAANIDASWVGVDAVELFRTALGREVLVVNDADGAGVAEVRYGAARDRPGVVLMVTLGTGIGTALFVDGILVPNTELGHVPMRGHDAERYAAASVRKAEGLSMKQYAKRLQKYLSLLERLLWPDLIVLGGGVSRRSDELIPRLDLRAQVVAAHLQNSAGIVGAAALANRR